MVASIGVFGQYSNSPIQQQRYVPDQNMVATINITMNQVQNGWAHWGNVCAGCPAYFYQVLVTQQPHQAEDGNYYYYYYFNYFSNSHYTNGAKASTYLSVVNFYANNQFIFQAQYILVAPNQNVFGAWLRLGVNNAMVTFAPTNVTVY